MKRAAMRVAVRIELADLLDSIRACFATLSNRERREVSFRFGGLFDAELLPFGPTPDEERHGVRAVRKLRRLVAAFWAGKLTGFATKESA